MKIVIKQANGTEKTVDTTISNIVIPATPGATYRPLDERTSKAPKTTAIKRVHDDLVIDSGIADGTVTVEKFFKACSPENRCSAVLEVPGSVDATVVITQDGDAMHSLLAGQTGVMSDGQTLTFDDNSGVAAPVLFGETGALVSALSGSNLLLALGGLALAGAAAGGGGGGGGSGSSGGGASSGSSGAGTGGSGAGGTSGTSNVGGSGGTGGNSASGDTSGSGGDGSGGSGGGSHAPVIHLASGALHITGTVAAGPMKAGTVEVLAYDKDGNLLGISAILSDAGNFSITVSGKAAYSGTVLLVAHDMDAAAADNFVSEANGQLTNLGTNLGAVGTALGDGATLVVNITPLTQLAAMKLGYDVNAAAPVAPTGVDADQVAAMNHSIGTVFGVADILGTPVTINDAAFRAAAGTDGWANGVALAKLSVLDQQYGSVDGTLQHLNSVLTVNADGSVTNSDAALADIATSLTIANNFNNDAADVAEALQSHAVVNIAREGQDRIETALPVNAVAGDILHLTLAGVNGSATGATYTLTAADIDAGFANVLVSPAALAAVGSGWVTPTYTVTDANGVNASAPITEASYLADVIAPQPVITVTAVAATASAPAGVEAMVSFAGMSAGDAMQISWDGTPITALHTVTAADVTAGGFGVFVPATTVGTDAGSFSVAVVDWAGNPGDATLQIAASSPTQNVAITSVSEFTQVNGSVTGAIANGTSTDGRTPALTGTLDAPLDIGQVLAIYDTQGGVSTLLGNAVVNGTSWTFTPTSLAVGTHAISATVVDSASGMQGQAPATFTVIEQSIAIAGIVDTHGLTQGAIAAGGITDDSQPTITGSLGTAGLGSGEILAIYDGSVRLGVATVSGTSWSFTPGTALPDGAHSITAMVEDANGNATSGRVVSATQVFSVDTLPQIPTTIAINLTATESTSLHGSTIGQFASGTSTDGTTPLLSGALTANLQLNEVLVVYDGQTLLGYATVVGTHWTFATPVLGLGSHALTAVVENTTSGQNGTASAAFVVSEQSIAISGVVDAVGPVQGLVTTGGFTDDVLPTITGTLGVTGLGPNEVVAVYDGAVKIGNASVSGTSWSFSPTVALGNGTHGFTAAIEDSASTTLLGGRVVSAAVAITVDTSGLAPTQSAHILTVTDLNATNGSAIGPITNGASTDETNPLLAGTVSALLGGSQVVAVYDTVGGVATRLGTAASVGLAWTFATPPLAAGAHSLTAVVENATNGAQGTASPAFVLHETSISLGALMDDVGPVQGPIAEGGFTDDNQPTLSGSLVATLGTGEVVAVYDGLTKIGEATVSGNGWTFAVGTPLADGAHSLHAIVEAHSGGTAQNGGADSTAIDFVVMTGASGPTTLATIGQVTENTGATTGAFASGTSTDGRTPTLTGTISAPLGLGEVVAVYDGTTQIGTATVSGTGWSFTTPTLATGSHSLTVVVLNVVSNTPGTASTPFVVNEQAITALGLYDDVGAVQGQIAQGAATDDSQPTFSGTLGSSVLGAGEVVAVYDGTTRIGVATVTGTAWTFTPATALTDGAHQLSAVIQDTAATTLAAGRLATSTFAFNLDTSGAAPTQTIAITAGTDTNAANGSTIGTFTNGNTTDDTAPGLIGNVSAALTAGQVVAIYDGGVLVGNATVSGTTWTYAPGTLAVGSHSFTAVVQNSVSGAQGTPSSAFVVNENSIALTSIVDNVGLVQGNLLSGSLLPLGVTDDNTPTLTGTLGQATLGAGEVVAIYDGATKLGNAVVTGTGWSFTPGVALADGAHSLRAMVQDGTTGTAISGRVVSDTDTLVVLTPLYAPGSIPTITGVSENTSTNGSAIGAFASGTSTDGSTPTLSGTLTVGLNVGDSLAVYDGATLLGTATVNGTNWTFTSPTLASGSHALTVVAVNAVTGNAGTASAPFVLIEQTLTVTSLIDDVGSTTGPIANGGATDDARPTFNGTLATATLGSTEVVAIYDGATKIGTATVTGTSWTFTPGSNMVDGAHSLRAVLQDTTATSATNGRVISTTDTFTLNTSGVVPTQHATILGATETTTTNGSVSGAFANATSTDGRTPQLSGSLDAPLVAGQVVAVYDGTTRLGTATVSGNAWTYTTPTLAVGAHNLTAQVENAATGTHGPASSPFQVIEQSVAIDNSLLLGIIPSLPIGLTATQVAVNGLLSIDYTPAFTGTLGSALGTNEVVALYDGTSKLGEATVTGTTWTFTPSATMPTGIHLVTALVQNHGVADSTAGRVVSAPSQFMIDLNVGIPTQLVSFSSAIDSVSTNGSVTGNIGSGNSTDATTPVLSGTLSSALVGAQILAVYDGLTLLGDATVSGTSWSFTPTTPLALGAHVLTAQVQNPVSLLSGGFSASYVVNVQSIGGLSVYDNTGTIQGVVASGGVTDDNTPTLNGSLGSAAIGLGEAVVVYDTVGGVTTQLGTALVVGTNWSFTPLLPMADGTHHLTAMVEAAPLLGGTASNGRVVSGGVDFTIDTSLAPTQIVGISTVTDNYGAGGSRTGALASGATIDDTAPVINGSLSAALIGAQEVAVYDTVNLVTTKIGYATVDSTNLLHWSFTPTTPLANGTHTLTAQVENTATGSHGLASLGFSVNESQLTLAIGDNTGAVQGDVLGFGNATTDDATLALSGHLGSALVLQAVKVYDNGALLGTATVSGSDWSFNTSTLATGTHSFGVHVENIIGGAFTVATGATVTVAASDPLTTVADTSFTSSGSVARLDAHGSATTIDLTQVSGAAQPHIDVVELGSATNTLKLSYDDVLQSASASTFTAANGWAGLAATGFKQMVVDGASGTVTATAGTWAAAGTVTHGGETYAVYNDSLHNAQLLIDTHLTRTGPIA